jgi:cap1 methyltransferase
MIIYNFTQTHSFLFGNVLRLKFDKESSVIASQSLYHYLTESKKKIDNNVMEWDFYKKLINPYEFIHTSPNNSTRAVAEYSAISRSFYKLIEIVVFFNLFENFEDHIGIKSFHLAEGPGGFIEAMVYIRKHNSNDMYHGMTLLSNNKNIPKWSKLRNKFRFYKGIHYELGATENGDLLSHENFTYCFEKYKNSMGFMTGDGGFDFSVDYEKQEVSSTKLVLAQILYALMMQARGGTFVLKIFDIFHLTTIEMLYLLNVFYDDVTICKPKTSRFANSEKYVVCKRFLYKDTSCFYNEFLTMFKEMRDPKYNNKEIVSLLNMDIPLSFMKEIEELNCIFGKKQLNTIHNTLMMIQERRSEKIERLRKANIEKCIQWCNRNNIPCNNCFKPQNIFKKNISRENYIVNNEQVNYK